MCLLSEYWLQTFLTGSTDITGVFKKVLSLSRSKAAVQCTEVHFASFLSGEFTTMAVMNPLEKKLKKRTSVGWGNIVCVMGCPTNRSSDLEGLS